MICGQTDHNSSKWSRDIIIERMHTCFCEHDYMQLCVPVPLLAPLTVFHRWREPVLTLMGTAILPGLVSLIPSFQAVHTKAAFQN